MWNFGPITYIYTPLKAENQYFMTLYTFFYPFDTETTKKHDYQNDRKTIWLFYSLDLYNDWNRPIYVNSDISHVHIL